MVIPRPASGNHYHSLSSETLLQRLIGAGLSAEGFTDFFQSKVERIRAALDGIPAPDIKPEFAGTCLQAFSKATKSEIRKTTLKPLAKSSHRDLLPTFLIKEMVDLLVGFITCKVNASFKEVRLPDPEKEAIIMPQL